MHERGGGWRKGSREGRRKKGRRRGRRWEGGKSSPQTGIKSPKESTVEQARFFTTILQLELGCFKTERLPFHSSLSCIGEGNGNPLQCSCLGAWWAAIYGVAHSQTRLKRLSSSSSSSSPTLGLCIRGTMGFPGGSAGKESACNVGNLGSIPGMGRSPGEGKSYPLQYSGLENSMDCLVHGVAKSQT